MSNIQAEIISIGDELLIGQVINTNASWIASELNKNGIGVFRVTAIGDNEEDITSAIVSSEADIIITTGGLGPTKDDITKSVLAKIFNSDMIFHEPSFQHIVDLFGSRNYPVTDVNQNQALIPDKCIPLPNIHGTAPGMWFEHDTKIVVSLPGVPFEMKTLISEKVIPRLKSHFNLKAIYYKTIMTIGVGESMLAERISKWEDNLPKEIKLAYLPQPGIVRLRLSTIAEDELTAVNTISHQVKELNKLIPEVIFGYDDISIEEVIGNLLKDKKATISTAESCTGGYLAHLITSIPGSSEYFKGSVVSYANEIKIKELDVLSSDIDKYGAVSQQVVEQMAMGVRKLMNTNYSIATSGIAGPDGGTLEKPVGTVWIAVATPEKVISKKFLLGEHRGRNIRRSSLLGLNMLRLILLK